MAWRSVEIVNQRKEFVLRAMDKSVVFKELCMEFGISRKTGYKWQKRFLEEGIGGLEDQPRSPHQQAAQTTESVACDIIKIKMEHRMWGPRKIRAIYARQHSEVPSESTFKRILDRVGLVERRKKRRKQAQRLVYQEPAKAANHIWTIDFKGWWRTASDQRCEPLTIRDEYSRYIIAIRAMQTTKTEYVKNEFDRVFQHYGLPSVIRSDNGSPFACSTAPLGLTRLSVWWLQLGIDLDRIDPGHPEQNGAHERMHRDIQWEIRGHVNGDLQDHQAAFDIWRQEFNHTRPHEALDMRVPIDFYEKSSREYVDEHFDICYPAHIETRKISKSGFIKIEGKMISLSTSLSDTIVGLERLRESGSWAIWVNHLRLGEVDRETWKMNWQVAETIG